MKKLYLFDFDGTLTRKDSFLDFILFDKGHFFFIILFIRFAFLVLLFKLKLYDAEKLKLRLFNFAYLNIDKETLEAKGRVYLEERPETFYSKTILDKYKKALVENNDVYIVSASLDVWLKYFVKKHGGQLICTELAYKNNVFIGQFATPNCNSYEKAIRIKSEINLDEYAHIISYGNSKGDEAMFDLSTQSYKV